MGFAAAPRTDDFAVLTPDAVEVGALSGRSEIPLVADLAEFSPGGEYLVCRSASDWEPVRLYRRRGVAPEPKG